MKAVLISIKPKWCEKIANGEKTIEVRKTRPKMDTPFKCYIYCTQDFKFNDFKYSLNFIEVYKRSGKVIGEFVCDRIDTYPYDENIKIPTPMYDGDESCIECGAGYYITCGELKETCLTDEQFDNYGKGKTLYAWHISDLVIYDEPKELSEFFTPIGKRPSYMLERPFQSWGYVEEKEQNDERN